MIPNVNPNTGIRYGVMNLNNLDGDLIDMLWYGPQARDLSYEFASREIEDGNNKRADDIEEECAIAVAERDGNLSERDREKLVHDEIEAAYERLGYQDREDFIECEGEMQRQDLTIQEPQIAGEYEHVKYGIGWLGGAPLLWIYESPCVVLVRSLCSPCVPGAGDLDSGFAIDGHMTYGIPPGWATNEGEDA